MIGGHELNGIAKTNERKPYEMWAQDFCDSVGDKKYYPKKNMKSMMVTYHEFARIHNSDMERVIFPIKEGLNTSLPRNVSNLYRGFFEAIRIIGLNDDKFKKHGADNNAVIARDRENKAIFVVSANE